MAQGGTITIKAILDSGRFKSGVAQMKSGLAGVGGAAGGMGSKVSAGASAAGSAMTSAAGSVGAYDVALGNLAAQGLTMVLGKLEQLASTVLDVGMTFESSMSKVQALSGASAEDMQKLESVAREMGSTTQFSASEASDALGYMALAGWNASEMTSALPGVLDLAAAGQMDLAQASDLVTDYLSAFSMEASEAGRMADVMAFAQGNSNTSTEQLGQALKNCAANANAAGLDIETTSAALGMMANQGLKGSEAGTALNAIMRDMTSQMQDGAIAIGDTSVAVTDAEGNYRNFCDIMADVEAATQGMGDAERAAALQQTFTADSTKGLNLLLNSGSKELRDFASELYNSSGAASDMASTMNDNLAGDVKQMGSAFEELALKMYDAVQGPLRSFVQFITGSVVPALTFLVENGNVLLPIFAGIGGAILALKWGSIVSGVTRVIGVFQAMGALFMANPLGLAIVAIAAVVAALVYFYNTNENVRNAVQSAWEAIKAKAQEVWAAIGPAITSAMEAAAPVVEQLVHAMGAVFEWMATNVLPIWVAVFSGVCDFIIAAVGAFNTARGIVSAAINGMRNIITSGINAIKSVFSTVTSIIGVVAGAFNAIKSAMLNPIESARSLIQSAISRIKSIFPVHLGNICTLRVPHISVNGGSAPWGIGGKGTKPSFSVSWYAKGGIFNSPSLIGIGEAGPEAVLPLNSRTYGSIAKGIAAAGGGGATYNIYFNNMHVNNADEIGRSVSAAIADFRRRGFLK